MAERDFTWRVGKNGWSYRGPRWTLDDLPPSALTGAIQYRNAATAIAAIEALDEADFESERAIATGLRSVELRGRFQIVPGPVEWIFDVAHNEPAARVLAAHLRERPCAGRTFAVASILVDKDIPAIGEALTPAIDHWILCSLHEPRGLSAQALAARFALLEGMTTLADSIAAGCERARSLAKPGDRIVVCGSFLAVGAALRSFGLY